MELIELTNEAIAKLLEKKEANITTNKLIDQVNQKIKELKSTMSKYYALQGNTTH